MFYIFLLLLVCLLRYKSAKPFTFQKYRSSVLKALFPYAIILGHISFHTENPIILDFRYAGVYAVGLFFFMSGYGLESKHVVGDIRIESLLLRMRHLFTPLFLPLFLYLAIAYIKHISINTLIEYSINTFSFLLPFTWFVLILCLLYIGYYFLRWYFSSNIFFNVAMLVYLLMLMIIFHLLGYDGTLYECNFSFLVGNMYKQNEQVIIRWIGKLFKGGEFCLLVALLILLLITLSYVSQKPIFRGFGLIGVSFYVFAFMIVFSYVKIENNLVISYLQKISYEVYLCQGIVFILLSRNTTNIFIYSFMVICLDIVLATICYKITKLLRCTE